MSLDFTYEQMQLKSSCLSTGQINNQKQCRGCIKFCGAQIKLVSTNESLRVLHNCLVEKQERCFYKVRISNVNLCVQCRLVINLKLKEESSTAGNKVEHGVVKTKEKLVIVNHYFLEE